MLNTLAVCTSMGLFFMVLVEGIKIHTYPQVNGFCIIYANTVFHFVVLLGRIWQCVSPIAQKNFNLNVYIVCTVFTAVE